MCTSKGKYFYVEWKIYEQRRFLILENNHPRGGGGGSSPAGHLLENYSMKKVRKKNESGDIKGKWEIQR
jgi:hypothetical protein